MGLTIHFQGQLRSSEELETFVATVRLFADRHGWAVHPLPDGEHELTRMIQPEDPEEDEVEEVYVGPLRGLYVLPHAECEPLMFEFDRDLFMQDWCKTQFAGWEVHAAVIELFRSVEDLFEMLDVQDEAGFWDVPDAEVSRAALAETFIETRRAIREEAAESPGCSVGVLTPEWANTGYSSGVAGYRRSRSIGLWTSSMRK